MVCRKESSECDLAEHCTGDSGTCPPDIYKKNGFPCGSNVTGIQLGMLIENYEFYYKVLFIYLNKNNQQKNSSMTFSNIYY